MAGMLVQLDSRKRVSLAKIAKFDTYVVDVQPSGRIVLEPAVVLTPSEAEIIGDTQLWDRVEQRMAANGPTSPRKPRRSRAA